MRGFNFPSQSKKKLKSKTKYNQFSITGKLWTYCRQKIQHVLLGGSIRGDLLFLFVFLFWGVVMGFVFLIRAYSIRQRGLIEEIWYVS